MRSLLPFGRGAPAPSVLKTTRTSIAGPPLPLRSPAAHVRVDLSFDLGLKCPTAVRVLRGARAGETRGEKIARWRPLQRRGCADGPLGQFGYVVRQGTGHVAKPIDLVADPASDLPSEARPVLAVIAESLQSLQAKIAALDHEIAGRAKGNPVARRLMTMPGVSPIVASALVTVAPPPSTFRRGRDFAAWLGLTPKQHSRGQGAARPDPEDRGGQFAAAADPGRQLGG